ncbi:MAG: sigma 54-interacting transcriptional regulator [Sandaracinaceae bacterium]
MSHDSPLHPTSLARAVAVPVREESTRRDDASPTITSAGQVVACAGRENELAELTAFYRDAQRGEPDASKLVLLEGPSGMGKSRILSELKSRVRLQGGVVLEGRCEEGRAFGPFATIVERALRFLDEVGVTPSLDLSGLACRGGCHRLWHMHGGPDAEQIPFATDDLPGATPETAVFEKRLRFFDAVAALIGEVSRLRAPLIVLEHLEKADRGTLELLGFLLDCANLTDGRVQELRALFVASTRTDHRSDPRSGMLSLIEHEQTERMPVGTLGIEGIRGYLLATSALQRILDRTGGVPEAIDLLIEGEPLAPKERLRRRLGDLPASARALVEALAVLGRNTDLDELAEIARVSAVPEARHAFAGSDLIARSIVDGRILFSFEREVDRERCYELLDSELQRTLHARCAEVCARSVHLQEAARHALEAGELERAAALSVVAAAALSARHAHSEAAALLETFVQRTGAPTLEIRQQLADLYRVSGDYPRALVHARAIWNADAEDPIAAHRVGALLTEAGEHEEAAVVLVQAHQLAREPSIVAEVEAQLAELHYLSADYKAADEWSRRALEGAAKAGERAIAIQARNTLGKVALVQKDPQAAAALFESNRDEAAAAGLGHQEAQAHTNYAVALLLQRDLRGAEMACHTAIEVASRVCDTRERAIATENLAVIAHLGRRYGNALNYYHQAVGLLKRLGNRAMLARVANNLGELYLTLGERGRARGLCEFGSRVGGKLPSLVLGESLLLKGRVEAADGNISSARQAFHETLEIFERLGSMRAAEAKIELARLALYDGDVAGARAILRTVSVELSAKHRADLALVSADLERAAGGDTRASARRAMELAEACEDPERLLKALVGYARALGDASEVGLATRILERAQKIEDELTGRVPDETRAAWLERPLRAELSAVAGALASAWTKTRHDSVPPPRAITGTLAGARPEDTRGVWRRRYPELVGKSAALGQVLGLLDKVASSDALVLIRGESGTGKELVAEALHNHSARKKKAVVKVNCAALVETLLLSELFGHERGAFTGANARKKGRFEMADGGTIFLDEIGDISPKTQVALLRVLQEREFERVGGTEPIKVDVRIVAATHRDLEAMVRDGSFREDLYYRLRGVMVEMPPLRARLEDLPELCDHILHRIASERGEPARRMSPEALMCLAGHRWPGNVRELENVLRSATLFADGPTLVPSDFAAFAESFQPPEDVPARGTQAALVPGEPARPLESLLYERVRDGTESLLEMKRVLERECILRALDETDGNITRAAQLLGMKRPRLSQLVKQYGLSAGTGARAADDADNNADNNAVNDTDHDDLNVGEG